MHFSDARFSLAFQLATWFAKAELYERSIVYQVGAYEILFLELNIFENVKKILREGLIPDSS